MKQDTPRLWPSMAKLLIDPGKGPASVWRQYLSPNPLRGPESWSQKRGTVIDALVFGTKEVRVGNARSKHDPKKEIVVSPSLYADCSAAASSITSFLTEAGVELSECVAQEKLRWLSDGDVLCSGAPDLFVTGTDTIVDLKTSYSLSDADVLETIERYRYEIQAAAYLEAYTQLGRGSKSFAWLFAEKEAPYLCRWVLPSPVTVGRGSVAWRQAVLTWKECQASGDWPGPRELTV